MYIALIEERNESKNILDNKTNGKGNIGASSKLLVTTIYMYSIAAS